MDGLFTSSGFSIVDGAFEAIWTRHSGVVITKYGIKEGRQPGAGAGGSGTRRNRVICAAVPYTSDEA